MTVVPPERYSVVLYGDVGAFPKETACMERVKSLDQKISRSLVKRSKNNALDLVSSYVNPGLARFFVLRHDITEVIVELQMVLMRYPKALR